MITVGKVSSLKNLANMLEQLSAGVLQSRFSQKFCKIHKKTSAPESFNEVVGRRPQAYYFIKKETLAQVEICKILKNTFFIEQLWPTASAYININYQKASVSANYQQKLQRGRKKREKQITPPNTHQLSKVHFSKRVV